MYSSTGVAWNNGHGPQQLYNIGQKLLYALGSFTEFEAIPTESNWEKWEPQCGF